MLRDRSGSLVVSKLVVHIPTSVTGTITLHHTWTGSINHSVRLLLSDAARVACAAGSMQLPRVRPSVRLSHPAAASLLLWARQPGDIDRLLHGRRSAAAAAPQHGAQQQMRECYVVRSELSMGPFCATRSNPYPTQPTTSGNIWTQPNTTNNGAYSLVKLTYFYTLLVNQASTYSCSSLIVH